MVTAASAIVAASIIATAMVAVVDVNVDVAIDVDVVVVVPIHVGVVVVVAIDAAVGCAAGRMTAPPPRYPPPPPPRLCAERWVLKTRAATKKRERKRLDRFIGLLYWAFFVVSALRSLSGMRSAPCGGSKVKVASL